MPAPQRTMEKRLTKKQKRVLRQNGVLDQEGNINARSFSIADDIHPITKNQTLAFDAWENGYNVMLHGVAGTGKTFLALFFALTDVMKLDTPYKKVIIIRSVVPGRQVGFLPGTEKDKAAVYETPYMTIASKLFRLKDSYGVMKQKGLVEFMTTSFLRGDTLENCILIVDECQNMSDQELHTIMTRVGENCKIIFCGDVAQDDLTNERMRETSGLRKFMPIIRNMREFSFVEFGIDDIVRSGIVRSYIIERTKLGL